MLLAIWIDTMHQMASACEMAAVLADAYGCRELAGKFAYYACVFTIALIELTGSIE
jgi:hypothetical protein